MWLRISSWFLRLENICEVYCAQYKQECNIDSIDKLQSSTEGHLIGDFASYLLGLLLKVLGICSAL